MFRKTVYITIFTLLFSGCAPAVIPAPDFTPTPAKAPTAAPTSAPTFTAAPTGTSVPTETLPPAGSFTLTSPAFDNDGPIPTKYTCAGPNISPPLAWNDPPEGTASFALIVDDPDAVKVAGIVWDHWIIFNIPAKTRALGEETKPPEGSLQGITSGGVVKYEGPCPPPGSSHHYNFTLYALDIKLGLKAGVTKKLALMTMEGHILAQAKLTGLYPVR